MKTLIAITSLLAAGTIFASAVELVSGAADGTDKQTGFGGLDFTFGQDSWLSSDGWTDYETNDKFDLDSITLSIYKTWYSNGNMTTGFGIGIYEKTSDSSWTLVGKTDWFAHTESAYEGKHTFNVSGDLILEVDKTYTLAFFAGQDYLNGLELGSIRDSMTGASEWKNDPPEANTSTLAAIGILGTNSLDKTTTLYTNGGTQTWTPDVTFSGTPLPEPSMFGLLAGLGALALVGARRRRSRK